MVKKIPLKKRKYFSIDQPRLTKPSYYTGKRGKRQPKTYTTEKVDIFTIENKRKKTLSFYQVTDRKADRYRKIKTYKTEIIRKVKKGKKTRKVKIKFTSKQLKQQFMTKDSRNIAITERYRTGKLSDSEQKTLSNRLKRPLKPDEIRTVPTIRKEYDRTARITERQGAPFHARAVVESYTTNSRGRRRFVINIAASKVRPYSASNKQISIEEAINNATRLNKGMLTGDSTGDTEDVVLEVHLFFYKYKR